MTGRYYGLAALSGAVWAVVGLLLAPEWAGERVWAAVAASPLIGLVAACAFRNAYSLPTLLRVFAALLTLYLATGLFGLAIGIADAARAVPGRVWWAPLSEWPLTIWWGLTFSGLVLVLWPLAYLNHALLGRSLRTGR